MDLTQLSLQELQARAYKAIINLKMAENDLNLLEQEIAKRYKEVVEIPTEELSEVKEQHAIKETNTK
jgi:hypothetical protein